MPEKNVVKKAFESQRAMFAVIAVLIACYLRYNVGAPLQEIAVMISPLLVLITGRSFSDFGKGAKEVKQ